MGLSVFVSICKITNYPNATQCVIVETLTMAAQFNGSGSGTSTDPYIIYNAAQLDQMRYFLNREGVYFQLNADVDLAPFIASENPVQGWVPIGTDASPFKGVFNGNNHTIKNLKINRVSSSEVGLFGATSSATIKNLKLENTTIAGGSNTGVIGKSTGSTIKGMTLTGKTSITGSADKHGFIGYSNSSTISSISIADLTLNGSSYVGGIVGYSFCDQVSNTNIEKCDISGSSYVGGSIGIVYSSPTKVEATSYYNKTESTSYGITRYSYYYFWYELKGIQLVNCKTKGSINGSTKVGGMIGGLSTYSFNLSTSSYYSGTETLYDGLYKGSFSYKKQYSYNSSKNKSNSTYDKIENCEFEGDIIASSSEVGGIIGYSYLLNVNGCTYKGNISGTVNVGGIIGLNEHEDFNSASSGETFNRNFSYGSINGSGVIGGMIASNTGHLMKIDGCSSSMEVNGGTIAGGIVGVNGNGTITNSYFAGNINGASQYAGGIIGQSTSSTTSVTKSYTHSNQIIGGEYASGITAYGDGTIQSCASICGLISAKSGAHRICNSGTTGATGTSSENKGWVLTTLVKDGTVQTANDGKQEGTSAGLYTLKTKQTYVGMGWTFSDSAWSILPTESFPYLSDQTAPPYFETAVKTGSTTLVGKSIGDGTVYIRIGSKNYTATATANSWTCAVDQLKGGDVIAISAQAMGKRESYPVYQTVEFAGSGTQEDPFMLMTADDLQAMYSGDYYYKLGANIDVTQWIKDNDSSHGWKPIGTDSNGISFIEFDGDGHTISGLWYAGSLEAIGLFCKITQGNVKNIHVVTTSKDIVGSTSSTKYAGAIAGYICGDVTGCTAMASVTGSNYVGGLVGYIKGSISTSSAEGSISGSNYAGGLAAYLTGGSVDSSSFVGNVNLSAGTYAGGLVAYMVGSISKSFANAQIVGGSKVGGASGYCNGAINETFTQGSINTSASNSYVGGLVGEVAGNVSDCYSYVNVTATGSSSVAAGVAGYNRSSLTRCYAVGEIAGDKAAGVVGQNYGSSATISKCVALNTKINGMGVAMRVLAGFANGAPEPGRDNYAIENMAVSLNDVRQTIYDDPINGYVMAESRSKSQATYSGLGWDFAEVWQIADGQGYPLFKRLANLCTSLTLDKAEATVNLGQTITLAASVTPLTVDLGKLRWISSDPEVASVEGGKVHGLKIGTSVITVSTTDMSNLSASCVVSVIEPFDDANTITVADMDVTQGTMVVLPIGIKNQVEISAAQFDITLPEGVTIVRDNDDEFEISLDHGRATSNHSVVANQLMSGKVRVALYSSSSKALRGNNGTVVNINLLIADDAKGVKTITISDIELDDPQGNKHINNTCSLDLNVRNTNFFTTDDVTTTLGASVNVPVAMSNTDRIAAIECNVYVPTGLTLKDIILNGNRKTTHRLTYSQASDGHYHLMASATVPTAFNSNSGTLFTLVLSASNADTNVGIKTVRIANISLDNVNGSGVTTQNYTADDITAMVEIRDYIPGDANGDNKVSMADVVATVNYSLELAVAKFVFKAADMNGDDRITMADVVQIVNLTLSATAKSAPTMHAPAHIEAGVLNTAVDSNLITISIDNANKMAACQMDIHIPASMTITDVATDANHVAAWNRISDSIVRLAIYSADNSTFASDVVARISVTSTGETLVEVDSIYESTPEGVEVECQHAVACSILDVDNASAFNGLSIRPEGSVLVVVAATDQDIVVVDLSGVASIFHLVAGENTISLAPGFYIVEGHKIFIK